MNAMSTVEPYGPERTTWGNYSVDKITIFLEHQRLNQEIKHQYQTGPITIVEFGNHFFISFHAECLKKEESLLRQILFHLYRMALHSVFDQESSRWIRTYWENQAQYKLSDFFNLFANLFCISQIEMSFDFEGDPPWNILDHNQFMHTDTTLYSKKDYLQKKRKNAFGYEVNNGQKRSMVCIYNHSTCHGNDGNITRFEIRHCGSYIDKWNFLKLDKPFDEVLTRYKNQIAGSLHKALHKSCMGFDMDKIKELQPLLYPILNRWATWGMKKSLA